MSKAQYFRLTLVLLIPLIGIGWWIAENGMLIANKFDISCMGISKNPVCFTRFHPKGEPSGDTPLSTLEFNGARIINPITGKVRLFDSSKYIENINNPPPAPKEIRLPIFYMPATIIQGERYSSSCSIYSLAAIDSKPLPKDSYLYTCSITSDESRAQLQAPLNGILVPADPNLKDSLDATAREIASARTTATRSSLERFIAATLSPIAAYFFITALVVASIAVGRYIANGNFAKNK